MKIADEKEAYSEKEYSTLQTIFVPVINRQIECNISANLVFAKNSMVPILVNVSVTTDVSIVISCTCQNRRKLRPNMTDSSLITITHSKENLEQKTS